MEEFKTGIQLRDPNRITMLVPCQESSITYKTYKTYKLSLKLKVLKIILFLIEIIIYPLSGLGVIALLGYLGIGSLGVNPILLGVFIAQVIIFIWMSIWLMWRGIQDKLR